MSSAADSADNRLTEALRAARAQLWLLRFPPALETSFRATSATSAAAYIRRTLPWLTLMYVLVLSAIALGTDDAMATQWRNEALLPAGLSLAILWVAILFRRLDRHLGIIMGLAMTGALALMTRGVFLVDHVALARPVSYCVVYVLMIIFTLSRLRLRQALALTGTALAIVLLSAGIENLQPDWLAFAFYFPMTAILCAVICYVIEYRERTEFISTQILAIDKARLLKMQAAIERDALRQQAIGEYLKLVSGNPTPTEIAGRTLSFLIEHGGAQVGVVYLASGDRLRRAAAWGLEGETSAPDDLGRGETLIGQVAENRRGLRLSHLPADYHVIRTATGAAAPAELLVLPVCHQQQALAVIELAALAPFADENVELVERIAEAMAGTLVSAQAREALARVDLDDFNL